MIETQAIIDILAREAALDPSTLTSETVIRELGVDSLGMMNVLFNLEDATGIELEMDAMEKVVTIGDLVVLVQTNVAARDAHS